MGNLYICRLCLAKIPSGRKKGPIHEVRSEMRKGFSTRKVCSMTTIHHEYTIKWPENGRRAQLSRSFSSTPRGFSRKQLRRQGRSDDADRQVLASIQFYDRYWNSPLPHGRQAFLLLAQDAFGRCGNNGRTNL